MRRILAVFGFVLGCWLACAVPAEARELSMESMDVKLTVSEDGVLHVEERLRVRFKGFYNGIFRTIPYADLRWGGVRRSIALRVDAIQDGNGNDLKYWSTRPRGRLKLKIKVPGANDAVRDIVILYRALNVILAYDEADSDFGGHDELYWNIVGAEWEFPVQKVTCTVHLPAAVTKLSPDKIHTRSFQGPYRSKQAGPALTRQPYGVYHLASTETLHPGHGITIAVAFPPGLVDHPGFGTRVLWFFQVNWFLLIPLSALLLWFLVWWFRGRDSLGGRTIIPEFEPPEGLSAADVGVLLDERLDHHDVTGAIMDLAVRGAVSIKSTGKSRKLLLHRSRLDTLELSTFDHSLIKGLFGSERSDVKLSSLKYKFVARLQGLREHVADRLVKRGMWRQKPSTTRTRWTGITVATCLPLVLLGFAFGALYGTVAVVCSIVMFIIARHMARRTPKGLDMLARVLGMQEYMVTAERDRMKALPMEMFERLLPFAVTFGLHDRWLKAFGEIFEQYPDWYKDDGAYSSGGLANAVNGVDRDVNKSLYSGPRPPRNTGGSSNSSGFGGGWSGGSGFSGGGSSGGGFGGGGGGGW